MEIQKTLTNKVIYKGKEPYGGKEIEVIIHPANEDNGIKFYTPQGNVKANIKNASVSRNSILLKEKNVEVLNSEHLLATLYAYEITNANIELKNTNSKNYKLTTKIMVVPNPIDREKTLCKKINQIGVKDQTKKREKLTIKQPFVTEKLIFLPGKSLTIESVTNYPISGEEKIKIKITPENYEKELSEARPYIKNVPSWFPKSFSSFLAKFAYPNFGIGHGITENTFFYPPRNLKQWRKQEKYFAEIARHSIIDRIGEISLLERKLEGKVIINRSSHQITLKVLKKLSEEEIEYSEN